MWLVSIYQYILKIKKLLSSPVCMCIYCSVPLQLKVKIYIFSHSLQVVLVFALSIGALVIYFIDSSE